MVLKINAIRLTCLSVHILSSVDNRNEVQEEEETG